MPDAWHDENGDLIVDFSTQKRFEDAFQDRKKKTEYDDIDLASGYQESMIWTTADGRRIAIPNMSDSHLLNTIAYIRRRVPEYKRQLVDSLIHNYEINRHLMYLFDMHDGEDMRFSMAQEEIAAEASRILRLSTDDFLREFAKRYFLMIQEAQRRKIYLEVDGTKLAGAGERK